MDNDFNKKVQQGIKESQCDWLMRSVEKEDDYFHFTVWTNNFDGEDFWYKEIDAYFNDEIMYFYGDIDIKGTGILGKNHHNEVIKKVYDSLSLPLPISVKDVFGGGHISIRYEVTNRNERAYYINKPENLGMIVAEFIQSLEKLYYGFKISNLC